jgi:hypothetical protein
MCGRASHEDAIMPYQLKYHWQAEAALNALTLVEQNQVVNAIQRLQECGIAAATPVGQAVGPGAAEDLYVLRVGDTLSVMFTVDAGDVLSIQDVINRRFAQRYG